MKQPEIDSVPLLNHYLAIEREAKRRRLTDWRIGSAAWHWHFDVQKYGVIRKPSLLHSQKRDHRCRLWLAEQGYIIQIRGDKKIVGLRITDAGRRFASQTA